MELTINKLKSFGDLKVIDNLDLNFKLNKVHCIFGPSGCGKSTLFNIIAGVVPADGGEMGDWKGKKYPMYFRRIVFCPGQRWKKIFYLY